MSIIGITPEPFSRFASRAAWRAEQEAEARIENAARDLCREMNSEAERLLTLTHRTPRAPGQPPVAMVDLMCCIAWEDLPGEARAIYRRIVRRAVARGEGVVAR